MYRWDISKDSGAPGFSADSVNSSSVQGPTFFTCEMGIIMPAQCLFPGNLVTSERMHAALMEQLPCTWPYRLPDPEPHSLFLSLPQNFGEQGPSTFQSAVEVRRKKWGVVFWEDDCRGAEESGRALWKVWPWDWPLSDKRAVSRQNWRGFYYFLSWGGWMETGGGLEG